MEGMREDVFKDAFKSSLFSSLTVSERDSMFRCLAVFGGDANKHLNLRFTSEAAHASLRTS